MSIRVIASIGVMLCIAVTSLSIYLGVVEHVYSPPGTPGFALSQSTAHRMMCDSAAGTFGAASLTLVMTLPVERCRAFTTTPF